MSGNNMSNSDIEIDTKKILLALKKGYKYTLLLPLILVFFAFIYIKFIATPIYISQAKLIITSDESIQSGLSGLASQFGLSIPLMGESTNYLSTESISEILSSRELVNKIIDLNIYKNQNLFEILVNEKLIELSDSLVTREMAIKYFNEEIVGLENIINTSMVNLNIRSRYPELSRNLSNTIIEELQNREVEYRKNESESKRIFIEQRIKDIQFNLLSAESNLKDFREENVQIDRSPTLLLEEERLERELSLQTEIFISLKQQLEQINIDEANNISKLRVIDPPNLPALPSSPKKKIILLASFILGLISGGLISIKKYYSKIYP